MRTPCQQAIEDKIPYEVDDTLGILTYFPPCHICGAPAKSPVYFRNAEYTCPFCRTKMIAIKCHMSEDRTLSEKEARLKAALKRISKVADTAYYTEAVKKVRKGFGHKNYYQSTEEVMVALELLRRGYTIYHQVGIASFRVDFLIPELSVVLEVDGEPYHRNDFTSLNRTEMRDYLIEQQLGSNFKVIHIQTKYINRNVTKLVPAIKAIIYKQCS